MEEDMQLPIQQPRTSPRPPPRLIFNLLRRPLSFGRQIRRRPKYDQVVALAATIVAVLYAARKIRGEGLPWPQCLVCRWIFVVGVLIALPSSVWSLILHRRFADVWGRIALGSVLLIVASIFTDYFTSSWKWVSYLIWVLVCLPLILPSSAPLTTIIFNWVQVLVNFFRIWLAKLSSRVKNKGESENDQEQIAATSAPNVDLELGTEP